MGQSGTSTTVTQAADPWYKQQASTLYNYGQQYVQSQPYSPYPGSTVAGFQPAQLAAQDYLSQAFLGRPYGYQAPQFSGTLPQPYNPFAYMGAQPGSNGGSPPGQGDNTTQPNENDPNSNPWGASLMMAPSAAAPAAAPMPSAANPNLLYYGQDGAVTGLDAQGNAPAGYPSDWQTQMPGGPYPAGMPIWLDSWGPMPASPLVGGSGANAGQPVYTTGTPNTASGPGTPGTETPYVPPVPTTPGTPGTPGTPYTPPSGGGGTPGFPWPNQPGGPNLPPGYIPPGSGGAGSGITEANQAADVARLVAAGGQTPGVAADRAAGGIGAYQDPYENQVVNTALSDLERARQMAATGTRSQATLSGAFGGDRAALLEAESNRGYADAAARTAAQLRSQGFDRAASLSESDANRALQANLANQNAFFTGRGQQLQGAGLLGSLGGDIYNRTLGVAGAISGLGAEQQNQAQNEITANYARYQDAMNYPMQNFNFLSGLLTGVPQSTSSTQFIPGNRGAGFAGGALSGAGVGSTFGPWGAAIGGGLGGLLGLF